MDYLDLIRNNQVTALSENVFNQTLSPEDKEFFTDVLNQEEEAAVIEQLLTTNTPEWLNFIKNYTSCYQLGSKSVLLLTDHLDNSSAKTLLLEHLRKSSANQAEGLAICDRIKTQETPDDEVLKTLCETTRHCFRDVFNKIALIDEEMAALYQKTAQNYLGSHLA